MSLLSLPPPGCLLGAHRQTLPRGCPARPPCTRPLTGCGLSLPGVASPCPTEQGHRGAGAVALPRNRSAAVTRTVGPEQRSVRWAVAALRLEGRRAGGGVVPHPDPPSPQPRRPSPAAREGGRPAGGAPARQPAAPGASPATRVRGRRLLSAQLQQRPRPLAPHGPAPSPLARPVCKCEGLAANRQAGRARPAAPQPVGARGVRAPRPPPRGPSRARPARSSPHVGLGAGPHLPGGAWGASRRLPRGPAGWYGPRRCSPPAARGRRLPGNPRDTAHVAGAGASAAGRARPAPTPGRSGWRS